MKQRLIELVESDLTMNGSFDEVRAKMADLEEKYVLNKDEFLVFKHESYYDHSSLDVYVSRLETDEELKTRLAIEAARAKSQAKVDAKKREAKLRQYEQLKKELGL